MAVPTDVDQLPRIFQANMGRLFLKLVAPGMDAFRTHAVLEHGNAASMDEFLDRAEAQVDNYTANEAAKSFALTIAAIFERQLRIWVRLKRPTEKKFKVQELLASASEIASIDLKLNDLGDFLDEMILVANVVRHGEGPACAALQARAPQLRSRDATDYVNMFSIPLLPSEHLRIRIDDLLRFVRAATRFWGLADTLPLAVIDFPFFLSTSADPGNGNFQD